MEAPALQGLLMTHAKTWLKGVRLITAFLRLDMVPAVTFNAMVMWAAALQLRQQHVQISAISWIARITKAAGG
jgi:hypothetical protein